MGARIQYLTTEQWETLREILTPNQGILFVPPDPQKKIAAYGLDAEVDGVLDQEYDFGGEADVWVDVLMPEDIADSLETAKAEIAEGEDSIRAAPIYRALGLMQEN